MQIYLFEMVDEKITEKWRTQRENPAFSSAEYRKFSNGNG